MRIILIPDHVDSSGCLLRKKGHLLQAVMRNVLILMLMVMVTILMTLIVVIVRVGEGGWHLLHSATAACATTRYLDCVTHTLFATYHPPLGLSLAYHLSTYIEY